MTKARALADNLPEPTAGSDSLSVLNATSAALLKHKLDLNGTGGEIGSHDGDNVCQGFASDPYTGELYTIHSTNTPLDDTNVINKFDGNGAVVQTSTHHLDTPSTTLGKQQLAVSWDKNGNRWFWTGANARVSNQARYIRKFKITDGSGTDLNIASEVQYQVFNSTEINGTSTGSATTCVSLDSRYLITEYSGSNTNRIKVFPLQTIDNYQGSAPFDVSDTAIYNWTFTLNTTSQPLQGMASDGTYLYIFTGNVDPSDSATSNQLRVYVYTLTGTLVKEYTDFVVGETEADGDGAGTKYEFQGAGWTWQSGVPYLSVIIASGDQNYRQNRIWALGGKKGVSSGGIKEADQWRIITEFTGNQVPLSGSWERNDDMFGVHGTGVTESSGVFTFPSTGVYLVTYQFIHQFDQADGYTTFDIEGCTDGSSFNRVSRHQMGGSGGDHRSGFCNALVVVNNTSTHKVRFTVSNTHSANSTKGSTGEQQTGATFIRLSDV